MKTFDMPETDNFHAIYHKGSVNNITLHERNNNMINAKFRVSIKVRVSYKDATAHISVNKFDSCAYERGRKRKNNLLN